ncbi:MAG: hypothetical protein E7091_03985 [Bacteroidales bacterium]|nr:hypothetical protein [Bacteroidales bacterium]
MIIKDNYTFRKQILTCELILNMIEKDSLRFVGQTYGTNSRWDIGLKSLFIYQLLLGFQVPELMFDGSEKNWYVITGERQLKCIYEYITGTLTLSEEALGEFKKYKRFEELPLTLKRKLLNTEFFVTVLNPGVTQSDRYRIYEMGSVTEGSSDLWAVAKFVFPDGYNNLERIVDNIILSYSSVKQNRRQIVRLPLLWEIRNDVDYYTSKVSVSGSTKIDSILIPQLERYCSVGFDEYTMIEKLSFLRYEACKKFFSWKSQSLKTVIILLIMNGVVEVDNNESLDALIKKSKKLWEKRPNNLYSSSYNMLSEQIKYMSNKLK